MSTMFNPFYFYVDGNGRPGAGAKLYFFQTGTSTPQDTYTTSALTTPNTNPVVADANGMFPPIYLGTSADYKVILKDASDVTVATRDPLFAGGTSGRTVVDDTNYTASISDRLIAYTALTASRNVTLPPAINFPAGTSLVIVDKSGSAGPGVVISVVPDGSDLINGSNSSRIVVRSAYGSASIESNGATKWTVVRDDKVSVVRGYLGGLGTQNNSGTPNTKIDVAAGVCADDTNAQMLSLPATTLNCATTGVNGLDTGSLANSTWYHDFVIGKTDGTTALLASTSISNPTFPSGYTLKRRIGSFKTDGSAHILAYVQDGDLFQWSTQVADISATNPGTSAILRTLTVPTGLNVLAKIQIMLSQTDGTNVYGRITDPATADAAASSTAADIGLAAAATGGDSILSGRLDVRTNTSAQVRSRLSDSNSNTTFIINTVGWADRRGKDS